jgi:hypothetical protein
MKVSCVFCGEPVDTGQAGVYRKVICWAENTKYGKPGKIVQPVDMQQWAHRICFQTDGVRPESLF